MGRRFSFSLLGLLFLLSVVGCGGPSQPADVVALDISTDVQVVAIQINNDTSDIYGGSAGPEFDPSMGFYETGPLYEKDTITVSLSKDGFWFCTKVLTLEGWTYSHPDSFNGSDGTTHLGYTFSWADDEWGQGDPLAGACQ